MQNKYIDSHLRNRPSFYYLYKKSERLVSAVHLVIDHVTNKHPLPSLLRSASLSLLSEIPEMLHNVETRKQVQSRIIEIVSLLNVAYQCGYLSESNYRLLEQEYSELGLFLDQHSPSIEHEHLSKTALHIPAPIKERPVSTPTQRQAFRTPQASRPAGPEHQNRKETILNLVRQKKRVNVKDVAEIITDCSEKTLQRELIALVDQGVLKKEGERRWSTYLLAETPISQP